jgi:hypothetical protein
MADFGTTTAWSQRNEPVAAANSEYIFDQTVIEVKYG